MIQRTDLECEGLETVWLEITFPNTKSLFVCYIYRPPNSPVAWYDRFSNELEKVSYLNCETILTGDFNIDLLQPDVALNGRWHDLIQINNFTQIVKEPTRITENTCTLIDHIYVRNIDYVREVIVPKISISDNYATCLIWKKRGVYSENSTNIISYRDMRNLNQADFNNDLNALLQLENQEFCVNDLVNNLTSSFTSIINKHAPIKEKRVRRIFKSGWFNKDIKSIILSRDRAKRRGHISEFKGLCNKVVNMVRSAKREYYHKILKDNYGNSKMLWNQMGELTGKKPVSSPNAINVNNELSTDPILIANSLNPFFTEVANDILQAQSNLTEATEYRPPAALTEFVGSKLPNNIKFGIPTITEEQM